MAGLRIAIVSTDGTNVNDHFLMVMDFLLSDWDGFFHEPA